MESSTHDGYLQVKNKSLLLEAEQYNKCSRVKVKTVIIKEFQLLRVEKVVAWCTEPRNDRLHRGEGRESNIHLWFLAQNT